MKLSFIVPALFAVASCSSHSTPPALVTDAFAKSFPNATVKEWDKEDENYEANFTNDGKTMSATFTAAGVLEETETDITVSELPIGIENYIKTNYKGAAIKEAAIIVKETNTMYEAEIKGKDLLFDESGKFLKEEED